MTQSASAPINQHNTEIQRNRVSWNQKPALREAYHAFYREIQARINPGIPGPVVELGSGLGRIKDVIPGCVTSDVFANPWLDRQENAYALRFGPESVSHLILFDVWHHLRFPGTALHEFHRVLVPGGRLILFEPAASWLGRFVYHWFHHEPVHLRGTLPWEAPAGFKPDDADYFAAQGSATRLFWWGEATGKIPGWKVAEVRPITSFTYLASGGFSGPRFGGRLLPRLLRPFDAFAGLFPRAFAARLLVVLEKQPVAP